MKEWNFKHMNEAQIVEVDKLWKDGHAEALRAYGLECGEAAIKGYKRGNAISALMLVADVVIIGGAMYLGHKLGKQIFDKKLEATEDEKNKDS